MRYVLGVVGIFAWLAGVYANAQETGAAGAASRVSEELSARVQAIIDEDSARVVEILKDIHSNPELGFMEERTAGIVATELRGLGFDVTTGIGKTGVLAVLRNGEGPTVVYRADMDANAVEEATGLPYASSVRVRREDGGRPAGRGTARRRPGHA